MAGKGHRLSPFLPLLHTESLWEPWPQHSCYLSLEANLSTCSTLQTIVWEVTKVLLNLSHFSLRKFKCLVLTYGNPDTPGGVGVAGRLEGIVFEIAKALSSRLSCASHWSYTQ